MKILFLTQYYPPEVGAPQNRLHELAIRLKKLNCHVEVLTAMPNYPAMVIHEAYKGKKFLEEEIDGIHVYRSGIYVTKDKGIVKRLLNYFSFVFTSLFVGLFKVRGQYDAILVESPPLFLGISAYLLSRLKGAKLIFNVSDLWPESAEKLDLVKNKMMLGLAYKLEAFLYKKSVLVTGQTQGIVKDINERFPEVPTFWLPNGVDLNLFQPDNFEKGLWREKVGYKKEDVVFLYAGILGHAQGLEVILHAANLTKGYKNVHFAFLGSGPEKDKLIAIKEELDLENVVFHDLVPKSEIPQIVKDVDFAVVPLKKLPLFLGAIPSKIFENLAMKTPVLLGVDGEAKDLFIKEGDAGFYFEPENHKELARIVIQIASNSTLAMEKAENARKYVSYKFDRQKIANKFVKELEKSLK